MNISKEFTLNGLKGFLLHARGNTIELDGDPRIFNFMKANNFANEYISLIQTIADMLIQKFQYGMVDEKTLYEMVIEIEMYIRHLKANNKYFDVFQLMEIYYKNQNPKEFDINIHGVDFKLYFKIGSIIQWNSNLAYYLQNNSMYDYNVFREIFDDVLYSKFEEYNENPYAINVILKDIKQKMEEYNTVKIILDQYLNSLK